MTVNYLAVLVAAVASWIMGFAWNGVVGKQWMGALGWTEADRPKSVPVGPLTTTFIAELVMAVLVAGLIGHFGQVGVRNGIIIGASCWLAFVVPPTVVNYAFQKRPVKLTIIDSGHWLAVLLVQGTVIGLFG
jgi:hypothetical protein